MKLDIRGVIQWKTTYGGKGLEMGLGLCATPDDDYLVAGYFHSNDRGFQGLNKGGSDVFVLRIDDTGVIKWLKTIGGNMYDKAHAIAPTPDGGILIAGSSASNDGIFKGLNYGQQDAFLLKMDSQGTITSISEELSDITPTPDVSPNPTSTISYITHTLEQPTQVRVELVSSLGEVVSVLSDNHQDVGTHQVPVNTSTLASGTYMVHIICGSAVTCANLVVFR